MLVVRRRRQPRRAPRGVKRRRRVGIWRRRRRRRRHRRHRRQTTGRSRRQTRRRATQTRRSHARVTPRGRIVGRRPSTIPRFGSDSRCARGGIRRQGDDRRRASRAARCDARAHARGSRARGRGGGSGSSGDAIGPRYPDAREEVATFISSAAALRHAGCSWFDVARHAAFHACVRARVVAGGTPCTSPRSCDIRSRRRW